MYVLIDTTVDYELIIQAESRLAAGRQVSVKTRAELNQQAENLEAEIKQLENRIQTEKEEAAKVEEIIENSGQYFK